MLLRSLSLFATALAAIPVFGGSAGTYNSCHEISTSRDLAAATFHETVARGGDF